MWKTESKVRRAQRKKHDYLKHKIHSFDFSNNDNPSHVLPREEQVFVRSHMTACPLFRSNDLLALNRKENLILAIFLSQLRFQVWPRFPHGSQNTKRQRNVLYLKHNIKIQCTSRGCDGFSAELQSIQVLTGFTACLWVTQGSWCHFAS